MATGSGQTLNDRINAARYALAGQSLARCVCKATTEEVLGPKKKHLDYLLACTHEPNVSIPQMANMLIERTNHIHWVVVFKALVTVHHLMSYGNERFTQYLASSNYSFELSTFLDKTTARDFSMSTFIRRYSRYINEKALSYRLLAFDLCKVKRGNEGTLRLMPIDRLLKTLTILQNHLDALLEFDCTANDLNNGVINAAFMLLFRDLIGLFAAHNDGMINLLNKYFTLNRKLCREAFELYKKFLVRMDKVSDFLKVAEVVGIDKDDIPDLRRAPSSLVDALEQHLQNIESNKKLQKAAGQSASNGTPTLISTSNGAAVAKEAASILGSLTPPISRRSNTPAAASQVAATAAALAKDTSAPPPPPGELLASFRDDEVRKALEEEARVLSQYGTESSSRIAKTSPFTQLQAPPVVGQQKSIDELFGGDPNSTNPKTIDDIFGDQPQQQQHQKQQQPPQPAQPDTKPKSIDEMFGNADLFATPAPQPVSAPAPPIKQHQLSTTTTNSALTTDAFGDNFGGGAGGLLQPTSTSNNISINQLAPFATNNNKPSLASLAPGGGAGGGGVGGGLAMAPGMGPNPTSLPPNTGLFKGDLDSTLAYLAQNLTFDATGKAKK